MKQSDSRQRPWTQALLLGAVLAAGAGLGLPGIGWWMDYSDVPVRSDVMVVLTGKYERPLYAAELYRRGYAPEVWISRPFRAPEEAIIEALGVPLLPEEEVNYAILVKSGVPASRIRFYGQGVLSTADEARSFARAYDARGKKVLVVTSRFHARRARLEFRRLVLADDIRVAAPPGGDYRHWWRDRHLAECGVTEAVKTAHFLLGGMFLSRPATEAGAPPSGRPGPEPRLPQAGPGSRR